jgi:hypothetical protein
MIAGMHIMAAGARAATENWPAAPETEAAFDISGKGLSDIG